MHAQDGIVRDPAKMPFIGRERELDQLLRHLHDVGEASGNVVLVRGEAGIGKSHLLAVARGELAGQGWVVIDVRADELDREVPYAAFRHAVAASVDLLSPELAELASGLVTMLDVAAEQPLAAVHAAALHFFAALTDLSAAVLSFDDLELTDDDTIVLVASLLRQRDRHPIVLVGGLRKPELAHQATLGAFVDRVRRDGRLHEVELGPLDDDALQELMSAMLPEPPQRSLVLIVQRQTGGNPFFAIQSVLNLAEAGAIETHHSGSALGPEPSSFSDDRRRAFLDRVLRVGPQARRISRAVALLGVVGFGRIELAAELAGMSPADADAAFDSLAELDILRVGSDGGFRICHQLVRDALYQEIGPAERWRWHRMAADRLIELPSSPAVDLEVASHVRHIAEPGDERAITVLSRAAERACATAPRSAIPWFEQALKVTPPADPRRATLSSRLARALLLAGRPRAAVDAGKDALVSLPEGEARSRLVTLVVDALVLVGAMDEAAEIVDAELVHGSSSVRLLAKAAHVHMAVNRTAEALADARAVDRHLPMAPVGDSIIALGHLARMRGVQPRCDELPRLWAQMDALARQGPLTSKLAAYVAMSMTQAVVGETRQASTSIRRAQQLLSQVGWRFYWAELAVAQTVNAANLGDWSSALSIIESTEDELDAAGSLTHRDSLRALKLDLLCNRGDWAAAQRTAAQPLSGNPHSAAVQVWAHAGIDLLTGDVEAARTRLERQLNLPSMPGWHRPLLLSRLADAETEAGRPHIASGLLADVAMESLSAFTHPTNVAVRLAYGRAATDTGALQAALSLADEHGLALLRGQARLHLGTLDVDAECNLTEAARIFQGLRAVPWRRRAVIELRRRGLKIPRERTRGDALLTETEVQIARLVQQGHTNREIALTVFLSVKTVEHCLSRIYDKTSCSNRLELARAMDSGLLSL